MRGMTWDHPRGYDPLAAASREWERRTGIAIRWDRRSLQDFESFPVDALARQYELIVIDHPHVGHVTSTGCLVPFEGDLQAIAAGSIGKSFESYCWQGRQWALPIDAAAQVQAWAPARRSGPVNAWSELAGLAAEGKVALPLRPPHSLMSLFTLCGLLGLPLSTHGPELFPQAAAEAAALLGDLVRSIDPALFEMDPIAVLEEMASPHSRWEVAPLIYGYVSYAARERGERRIAFADIPAAAGAGPAGSALGGTGIAVSAFAADPAAAAAFARWIAGGDAQRAIVAAHGGQPAHADAWDADDVNARSGDFYRNTRATLDRAWLRPRHDGYMAFQQDASERLNAGLRRGEDGSAIVAALNERFRQSL